MTSEPLKISTSSIMDSSIVISTSSSVLGELPVPTKHKQDGDNIMTFQNGNQNDNSAPLARLSEPNLVTMQNVSTATSLSIPPQMTQQHNQVIEVLSCDWLNCFLKFTSQEELVNHVNGSHILLDDATGYCCRWVGCTRNGKKFNAKYKMRIHVRSHTNEKPHQCQICKKCFSRSENLKIHKRSHTGEKPYACPVEGCNKRYSNSSDRFKHSRTHIVDKPYVCKAPDCNKCYTDPSSLRKHARSHNHYVSKPENPTSKPIKAVISTHPDVVMNSDPLVVCPVLPTKTQPVITQVLSMSPQYIPISHLLSLIPTNSVGVKPVNNFINSARTDLPLKGLVANNSEQRVPELKKENASILSTLLTKEQNKIFLNDGNIKPQFQVKTWQHSPLTSGQSSLVTVIST